MSSKAQGTASCSIRWENGQARIETLEHAVDDRRLEVLLVQSADKVGVDVPLGWPDAFVDAVVHHRDGQVFGEANIAELARRRTDTWVWRNTQQLPLSVTTDRISYPAMRFARIVDRLCSINGDRTGGAKLVEVYPAAALRTWNLQYNRYKRDKGRDVLAAIIRQIRDRCTWLIADNAIWSDVNRDDHALDAFICALVARAHATGRCHPIPLEDIETARREGWIAIPKASTLETLASS